MADYHKLIRGCDVLCLLDCGQWTVPVYALQIQNGLFHWKDEHEGLSYDIFYCLEKVAFICRDGLYSGESVLYSIHSNIGSLVGIRLQDDFWLFANHESNRSNACHIGEFYLREISDRFRKAAFVADFKEKSYSWARNDRWIILYRSSQRIPPAYHQLFIYHSCGLYGFLFVGRL